MVASRLGPEQQCPDNCGDLEVRGSENPWGVTPKGWAWGFAGWPRPLRMDGRTATETEGPGWEGPQRVRFRTWPSRKVLQGLILGPHGGWRPGLCPRGAPRAPDPCGCKAATVPLLTWTVRCEACGQARRASGRRRDQLWSRFLSGPGRPCALTACWDSRAGARRAQSTRTAPTAGGPALVPLWLESLQGSSRLDLCAQPETGTESHQERRPLSLPEGPGELPTPP